MNYETYIILKETVMKAKKDLYTGISQNVLDKLLEKKFIKIEDYLEAKRNIEVLSSIVVNSSSILKDYEKTLSKEKIFECESKIVANFLGYNCWEEWIDRFFQENPQITINKKSSKMEITNEISKSCGYENFEDLFENFPYTIPEENKILENMCE